jgi:hypothetical protein
MAIIAPDIGKGTVSSRSPLITPGYPMASVPHSNPIAATEEQQTQSSGVDSAVRDASLAQVGEQASRVV